MKNHVNVPTSPNVPTGGYVSKRNFFCNTPLYIDIVVDMLIKFREDCP